MNGTIAVGIVGVGGRLGWAAEQAARTGARLALVHVCVPYSPLDRLAGDPTAAEVEPIDPPFARAFANVRARLGARRAVLTGSVSERLIDSALDARLLVIGDKRRGVIGRPRTGTVPTTVAAEAPPPVAVVPLDQLEGEPW